MHGVDMSMAMSRTPMPRTHGNGRAIPWSMYGCWQCVQKNVHWNFFLPDIYTSRLLPYRDPLPRTAKLELNSLFSSIQEIHLFNSGMMLMQLHENVWLDSGFSVCVYHFLHSSSPELGRSLGHAWSEHKIVLLRRTSHSWECCWMSILYQKPGYHKLSEFKLLFHDVLLLLCTSQFHPPIKEQHKTKASIFCPFCSYNTVPD